MKGFAFVLLCVVAIVQGRSAGVKTSNTALAALGENPWLVHLRLAVATSGILNSCAGSLVSQTWVLTSAGCVEDARFIWIRYGVVTVVNPELVTESSTVSTNDNFEVALVGLNRVVHITANIAPVYLYKFSVPASIKFCGYGAEEDGSAGERLSCFSVILKESGGSILAHSDDAEFTKYDLGAPLVSNGLQFGVLIETNDGAGIFVNPARYASWIQEVTGLGYAVNTGS